MGQPAVITNADIIDDTFAGLVNPIDVIELGKDTECERPGATLVNAVKQFEKDGGFKLIQEQRNAKITQGEMIDAEARRNQNVELQINMPTNGEALEKDREVGSE